MDKKKSRMMDKKKMNNILGVVLIGFCLAAVIWGIIRQNNLKKKNEIGVAVTTNFSAGGRGNAGGIWIDYIMTLNGKKYNGSSLYLTSDISSEDLRKFILHRNFPVAYYPSNPSISSIMIIPKDFARYNYPFPDSLNWVLKYFSK
ncbi:MAG: hypothetical protein ABI091_12555 [Ferruginibacter sp.]